MREGVVGEGGRGIDEEGRGGERREGWRRGEEWREGGIGRGGEERRGMERERRGDWGGETEKGVGQGKKKLGELGEDRFLQNSI